MHYENKNIPVNFSSVGQATFHRGLIQHQERNVTPMYIHPLRLIWLTQQLGKEELSKLFW